MPSVLHNIKASFSHFGKTALLDMSPLDWRWTQRKRQPDSYFHVLNAFIDRKDSYYSIHQIGGWEQGAHVLGFSRALLYCRMYGVKLVTSVGLGCSS